MTFDARINRLKYKSNISNLIIKLRDLLDSDMYLRTFLDEPYIFNIHEDLYELFIEVGEYYDFINFTMNVNNNLICIMNFYPDCEDVYYLAEDIEYRHIIENINSCINYLKIRVESQKNKKNIFLKELQNDLVIKGDS